MTKGLLDLLMDTKHQFSFRNYRPKYSLSIMAVLLAISLNSCSSNNENSAVSQEPAEASPRILEKEPVVKKPEVAPKPVAPVEEKVTDNLVVAFKTDLVLITAEPPRNFAQGMESLLTGIADQADLQLHIVSPAVFVPPAKIDTSKFAFIIKPLNRRGLIGELNSFFEGLFDANYTNLRGENQAAMKFRDDARLEVVIVSTDDAQGAGFLAVDFNPKVKVPLTVNTVTAMPTSVGSNVCPIQRNSLQYTALSKQTGGEDVDVCSLDWSAIGKKMLATMAAKSNVFALSKTPKAADKIEVLVNGRPAVAGTWTYNTEKNTVSIVRQSDIKNGMTVTIKYLPKPE